MKREERGFEIGIDNQERRGERVWNEVSKKEENIEKTSLRSTCIQDADV